VHFATTINFGFILKLNRILASHSINIHFPASHNDNSMRTLKLAEC